MATLMGSQACKMNTRLCFTHLEKLTLSAYGWH